MLCIAPVLHDNNSTVTSITCIPIRNAHKTSHLEKFETIIEGNNDVRMQYRKRGNLKDLTNKSWTSKVSLKRRHIRKK
jgi:hypothetical protein